MVWDRATGERYGSALTVDTSPVNDVAFSPDGRSLVSGHLRSAVVWSMDGDQAIGAAIGAPADVTTDASFSADGTRLVMGELDGDAVVYDAATRRAIRRIRVGSTVTGAAMHPDGTLVALGTIDGRVRFFDPEDGASIGALIDAGSAAVWQIAFSPDGRLLAVAVDPNGVEGFFEQARDGEVQLWDVSARRRVRTIAPRAGSVLAAAFSADGGLLATGSYRGRLDLWEVPGGGRRGEPITVSDDGFPGVAFDPRGARVAGGSAIGPVRVFRTADGLPAFPPLTGHTGPITGAAFSPTGAFLATTSAFGGTRLWDPATGLGYGDELAGSPRPGSLQPNVAFPFLGVRNAFSPDGRLLAVAGVETRAMLWEVDPAVWRRRACAIAGRNLSQEEWALYLPAGTPRRATCPEWPTG